MSDKIKTLIENSSSFAILTDENPEDHVFLLKESLIKLINQKNLPVLNLPADPKTLKQRWLIIAKEEKTALFPQKTSIRLPKDKYGVKEVAYKEEGGNLSLIITSDSAGISAEDLSFVKLPPEVDLVFCFFENREKIELFENLVQLPPSEKIIFIQPEKEETLTEKVFSFMKIIKADILENRELATLLWGALISETNNLSEKISGNTLSLASLLLEKGGDKESVSKATEGEKKASFIQLLGRLLARTYIDENLSVSWSFLNQRDFQKTRNNENSPDFLYRLLKKIKSFLPEQNLHVLMWPSIEGIKSLVTMGAGKEEKYLLPFAEKMQVKLSSRFFILGPFENFSKAELRIRQAIKEIILIEKSQTIR